jgi:TatD DNase family protein
VKLVDIGANLTNKSFRGDLEAVLARSRAAGVDTILVTGTSLEASENALELVRRCASARTSPSHGPGLFATAGVHPHHAKSCDERTLDVLRRLAAEREVAAIGECGLDYDRDFSPRPEQRRWFEAQLLLAAELQMPLFLHERSAHDDFAALIARHRPKLGRAVVHCFTGSEAELRAYLELDLHIGITGWICDERRGLHLRELVRLIPPNRLMIETDAPYLLPRTLKPPPSNRRNEPAFLPAVLATLAAALGRPEADLARETTATALEFFGLQAL